MPHLLPQMLPCFHSAALNASDHDRWTMLHYACVHQPQWVPELVQRGALVNQLDVKGSAPLVLAMQHHDIHPENIHVLLEAGADVNTPDAQGFTPLMHACHRYPRMSGVLLDRGARINDKTKKGWTALMAAACHNPALLPQMLVAGADLTPESNGWTVLQWACSRCPKSLPVLLAAGAQTAAHTRMEDDPLLIIAADQPGHMGLALAAGLDPSAWISYLNDPSSSVSPEAVVAWKSWHLERQLKQSLPMAPKGVPRVRF